MPGTEKQKDFMGLVYAVKTGKKSPRDVSKEVRDAAKSMTKKELLDFVKGPVKKERKDESKGRCFKITEEQCNEIMKLMEDDENLVVSLENPPANGTNIGQTIQQTKQAAIENGINTSDPDVKIGINTKINGQSGTVTFNPTNTSQTNTIAESKVVKVKDFFN